MKAIEELLRNLGRPEVLEFGLVTNRLPSVNIGGKFEPVDDEAPTTEALLQMLVTMGGSRYVEGLSDKPVQWTSRLDGVGVISVAAIMRKGVVQARFTVARREPPVAPAPSPRVVVPVGAPAPAPGGGMTGRMPGVVAGVGKNEVALRTSSPATPSSPVTRPGPPPTGVMAPKPPPVAPALPPYEPEDDDDEPTVQTMSPPLAPDPRSPVVRRPEPEVDAAMSTPKTNLRTPDGPDKPPSVRAQLPSDVEITRNDAGNAPSVEEEDTVALNRQKPPSDAVSKVPSTAPSAAEGGTPIRDVVKSSRDEFALDGFLAKAAAARASDLHVIAGRPLLLRIATDLLPHSGEVPAEVVERMVRELVPARLRETLENDGACDFALDHRTHGRFRVNASRQRTGYKLSMRVIPREVPTFASLGLPEAIAAAAKHHQGLILVTGPTGHGKTSTLAAIVDYINRETTHHVLTVEDPVEYVHPRKKAMMSQREVGAHTRSFAAALKASLREDPDVIVVGELRDAETVRMAVAASETGHLVIGTMNTPSAAKTIDRLIDLFPPAEQAQVRTSVASALRLVIGQRLVPSTDRTRLHVAVELLPTSIALYTMIRDGKTFQIPSLQQRGRAIGVLRLDESLSELVRAQKVALDVAKTFAENPQEVTAVPVSARKP